MNDDDWITRLREQRRTQRQPIEIEYDRWRARKPANDTEPAELSAGSGWFWVTVIAATLGLLVGSLLGQAVWP